jgi:AraC-like DNA-binding protein
MLVLEPIFEADLPPKLRRRYHTPSQCRCPIHVLRSLWYQTTQSSAVTWTIARIAAEHGFSSPSRFAHLFRRAFGAYPSELLQKRLEPPEDVSDQEPKPH